MAEIEGSKTKRRDKSVDLETIVNIIKNKGLDEVIRLYPDKYITNGMRKLDDFFKKKAPKVVPYVHWYYGETGTGKTLYAYDTFENIHSCRRLSFPEAKKYENVIFDNYDARSDAKRSLSYLMVVLKSMEYDNKITKTW